MYLHTGDRYAAAQSAWLLASFYDELSKMQGEDDDRRFINLLLKMISDADVPNLEWLMHYYEKLDLAEMPAKAEGQPAQSPTEVSLETIFPSLEELTEALAPYPIVEVTKQSRKRDKKKKDDKRIEYARRYCSCGTPRVKGGKGETEYVLPAKRSKWKKFLKNKSNRTVRRHKGYLPKGNGYRKMDDDLWIWW